MALELTIVTPEGEAYAGPVDNVVLPGSEGDFGVLENHERFLAPLRIGEAQIEEGGNTHWAAISDGFARVSGEEVVVLVDQCELADDIDLARAQAAKERSERRIREIEAGEAEDRLLHVEVAALERAVTRIKVAGRR